MIYITSYAISVKTSAILDYTLLNNDIVTLECILVSRMKPNVFRHVKDVKVFVFMTVVLMKFNLTHTQ